MRDTNFKKVNAVLLGQEYCGKSSLAAILTEKKLEVEYNPTIGVDYLVKYIFKPKQIKICFWDLAGHYRFRQLLNTYINNSDVICLCYTHNDPKSFEILTETYNYFKDLLPIEQIRTIIVQTKCDLNIYENNRVTQMLNYFNKNKNFPIIKTSSVQKSGLNTLVKEILNKDFEDYNLKDFILPKNHKSFLRGYCTIL